MTNSLMLAAVGLEGPGWDNDYYPEDLPEDWRLGYYANEFPGILIPAGVWSDAPDVGQWLEDVDEAFEFYFLVGDGMSETDRERVVHAGAELGTRLKGLILEADSSEGYSDLLTCLAPLLSGRTLAVMTPFQGLPLCWQGDSEALGPYGPGLLKLGKDASPRQLREFLEQFCAATKFESPVLFVEAPVSVFETLNTLIDLMGL